MLFSVSRALKGELFDKDEVALIEKFMRMAIVTNYTFKIDFSVSIPFFTIGHS